LTGTVKKKLLFQIFDGLGKKIRSPLKLIRLFDGHCQKYPELVKIIFEICVLCTFVKNFYFPSKFPLHTLTD